MLFFFSYDLFRPQRIEYMTGVKKNSVEHSIVQCDRQQMLASFLRLFYLFRLLYDVHLNETSGDKQGYCIYYLLFSKTVIKTKLWSRCHGKFLSEYKKEKKIENIL
jgi:hypothetical protein